MVSTKDKKTGTILGSILGGILTFILILIYFFAGAAQTVMAISVARSPLPSDLKKAPYGPTKKCDKNLVLAAVEMFGLQAIADATAPAPGAAVAAKTGRPGGKRSPPPKVMRGGGPAEEAEKTIGSVIDWFSTNTVGWPYDSCGAGLGIAEWFALSMKWAWAEGRKLLSLALAAPILAEQLGKPSGTTRKSAIISSTWATTACSPFSRSPRAPSPQPTATLSAGCSTAPSSSPNPASARSKSG